MPIYSYRCGKCGHITDLIRKYEDSEKSAKCEKCEGEMLRTFDMSNVGFELKGNWFKNTGKY